MIKKLTNFENHKVVRLLKVSLILNIFCLSIIAGAFIFKPDRKHHFHKPYKMLVEKQIMKEHRKSLNTKKIELEQALLEQPYNKQKVSLALTALELEFDSVKKLINHELLKKAEFLEPQERLELLPPHLKKRKHFKHR